MLLFVRRRHGCLVIAISPLPWPVGIKNWQEQLASRNQGSQKMKQASKNINM